MVELVLVPGLAIGFKNDRTLGSIIFDPGFTCSFMSGQITYLT